MCGWGFGGMYNIVVDTADVEVQLRRLADELFFCTIDLSYLRTFFRTTTAAQYTCERFLTST